LPWIFGVLAPDPLAAFTLLGPTKYATTTVKVALIFPTHFKVVAGLYYRLRVGTIETVPKSSTELRAMSHPTHLK
jgi:hypothetical protein